MSVLTWLKAVTQGDASADLIHRERLHFAAGEQEFHGLDMKQALDAHVAWCRRLEAKLNGESDEALSIGNVAPDNLCTLGKWINGEAQRQFGGLPRLEELKRIHTEFHLKAGAILNDVLHGAQDNARAGLKSLRHESGRVQLALVRLYAESRH